MSEAIPQAQIEAANAYEALFVPALFGQWAPRVLDAARVGAGRRVLDVACGTGILGREAAARVGEGGTVVGIDPSAGMLAVARRIAPRVEWLEAVAESLPFPDHSFDAVVSQFGLMFFGDRSRATREMLRVCAPGGRVAVAVWDALESMPAYGAEVALLEDVAGRRAADALRAPFVLGDPAEVVQLFADAGVASPEIATHRGTARFPDIRTLVEADLRGWLPVMGVFPSEEQIDRILQQAERALGPHVVRNGGATFELSAHLVSATVGVDARPT